MSTEGTTEYYPMAMRVSILGCLVMGCFGVLGMYFGVRRAYVDYTAYRSAMVSIGDIFMFLPIGSLVSGLCLSLVRMHWFVMSAYTLSGSKLEIVSPVFPTRRYVELCTVTKIKTLNMYVLPLRNGRRDSLGRALHSSDGAVIRLSTDLAMWPEVEKLCVNASLGSDL